MKEAFHKPGGSKRLINAVHRPIECTAVLGHVEY